MAETAHPLRATGPDREPATGFPRSIIVLIGLAGAVVVGAGLRGAAEIIAPAMLALVLTIALDQLDPPKLTQRPTALFGAIVTVLDAIAVWLLAVPLPPPAPQDADAPTAPVGSS